MKRINDPALINRNAHEIPDFDYDSYPTVGDVLKVTELNNKYRDGVDEEGKPIPLEWDGYYLRIMPDPQRADVVIVTDEEYDAHFFELPADMPSWVLEWIAYVYKETYRHTKRWAERSGYEDAQRDIRKALGLPSYRARDIERLEARVDELEGEKNAS